MTEFSRLLDSSSNQGLRALLESSLDDTPPPDALPKVAAAMGVTAALLPAAGGAHGALVGGSALATVKSSAAASVTSGSTTVAVGSLAGSAGAGAATTSVLGTGMSLAMLGKTLMVSMVSAGLATAGAITVSETYFGEPHTNAPSAVAQQDVTGPTNVEESSARGPSQHGPTKADTPVDPSQDEAPPPVAASLQAAAAGAAVRPPSGSSEGVSPRTTPKPQSPHGNLSREVRQIDSARTALESKNASGALAELETYDRTRQSGALDREAMLLRIEALAQQQDFVRATALARDYLGRFPNDAHAARLRALVAAHSTHAGRFPIE